MVHIVRCLKHRDKMMLAYRGHDRIDRSWITVTNLIRRTASTQTIATNNKQVT